MDVWRDVVGYEGLYQVNWYGQVYSLISNKILKSNETRTGYLTVELFKGGESKRLLIHRLVAIAFIPNPHDYPQINHKDENPKNNRAENLEWCTAKYNMNYGNGAKTRHLKIDYSTQERKDLARINGSKTTSKPVIQLSKSGEAINTFSSMHEASRQLGINFSHIAECANGKRKSAGGYKFMFERNDDLSASQP